MRTSMSLKQAGNDISKQKTQYSAIINLSKIKYKDGVICKDSCNGNPGYGLWCIDTTKQTTTASNDVNVVDKQNMKLTFKNSINEVLSEYDVPNKDVIVESMDTMLINELKVRCEELQCKLADALFKVYDRETRCANAENMRREYEKLVNDNIEQKKMLMSRNSQLENHVTNLSNALCNAKKEINRLNSIIGGARRDVDVAKAECERVVNEEKEKQKQLMMRITRLEKDMEYLTMSQHDKKGIVGGQVKLIGYSGSGSGGSMQKYEYQIKCMNEYILELQMEIRKLKEKVKTMEDDKKTLKEIIKYKDKKNNYQQQSIDKLYTVIEAKDKDMKWNRNITHNNNNNNKSTVNYPYYSSTIPN